MITDTKVEQAISVLLRAGVLLAAMVVLAGGALYLGQHHGSARPDYSVFRSEPNDLRDPGLVIRTAFTGDPAAIIQLGLLLLILTPVARVFFSVAAFALERDFMYVVMTLIVLGVLLYSLLAA